MHSESLPGHRYPKFLVKLQNLRNYITLKCLFYVIDILFVFLNIVGIKESAIAHIPIVATISGGDLPEDLTSRGPSFSRNTGSDFL